MHHIVTAIGTEALDPLSIVAPSSLSGDTDLITVEEGQTVAVVNSIGDYMALALTFKTVDPDGWTINGSQPEPGDTVAVIGAVGSIPDYQRGMFLTVDADGVAHFVNAGHLAENYPPQGYAPRVDPEADKKLEGELLEKKAAEEAAEKAKQGTAKEGDKPAEAAEAAAPAKTTEKAAAPAKDAGKPAAATHKPKG